MTSQATMAIKSSSHAHWMAASGQWKQVEKNLEKLGNTSLQSILTVFDSGINEEQAWAICFQAARNLSKVWAASKVSVGNQYVSNDSFDPWLRLISFVSIYHLFSSRVEIFRHSLTVTRCACTRMDRSPCLLRIHLSKTTKS